MLFRASLIALSASAAITLMHAAAAPNAPAQITIDGAGPGREFDGIGGVSAGASTRLLFDYPEPQRSDILDYLFKPNYGAGIQILKVEIGSDVNSTDGSEPSHQRTRDEVPNYERGYEWWLMKEAKARNPDIILAGLEWGAPGWMKSDAPGKSAFWSRDNLQYVLRWLDGARKQGLKIDYVGGWNETGFDEEWLIALHHALQTAHPGVKIIAADDLPQFHWRIAKAMLANPKLRDAVDVLGQHSPGEWRSLYRHYSAPPEAQQVGKPLWASEQSSLSHDVGGGSWARGLNRAYIDARITASINWAPVSAWYANLPIADTGLILAEWPWSGYYELGSTVWVYAHTSQFAQPGWQYIDDACGYIPGGASYVTLKAPSATANGRDFSVIVETMDAATPTTVRFAIQGGLSDGPVHVWSTHVASATLDDDFVESQTIQPVNGRFSVTLRPGCVYTLSTTTGQHKGGARPSTGVSEQMPLPFREDFESYRPGQLARYFSDVNGGFETAPGRGRKGMVYRQVVPHPPVAWNVRGAGQMQPTTMFGDPRWWGDYEVSTDVLLEQPGYVELIARIAAQSGTEVAGYHLRVDSGGTWRLYSQDLKKVRAADEDIAAGRVALPVGTWNSIALRMRGSEITVVVNGRAMGTVRDSRHVSGNVAIRVGDWIAAELDNIQVTPTAPTPGFVPQRDIAVSATSEHPLFYRGDVFPAAYVIDGRPESFWHTRFGEAQLPQAITLDLGSPRAVSALTYQPRLDNDRKGMITRYKVYLGTDAKALAPATEGTWPISTATKVAGWPTQTARFIRLEAVEAVQNAAAASEINISTTPIVP